MLTKTGRRLNLVIPATDWAELEKARLELERLTTEHRVTATRLQHLEDDRPRAVEGDRKRLARALRKGEPDPGQKATEKCDRDLAATRRRMEALADAVAEAEAEAVAVVEDHRDAWLVEATEDTAEANTTYAEALEAMVTARAERDRARAQQAWLQGFPDRSYSVTEGVVRGLPHPSGDPFVHWQVVLDALRRDAE